MLMQKSNIAIKQAFSFICNIGQNNHIQAEVLKGVNTQYKWHGKNLRLLTYLRHLMVCGVVILLKHSCIGCVHPGVYCYGKLYEEQMLAPGSTTISPVSDLALCLQSLTTHLTCNCVCLCINAVVQLLWPAWSPCCTPRYGVTESRTASSSSCLDG